MCKLFFKRYLIRTLINRAGKFLILVLVIAASSCVKKGYVCYRFEVCNATDAPMTVHLSSWGRYTVSINGMYDSGCKFHDVETIKSGASLIFNAQVGDNPNPHEIPSSIVPAWNYIVAIECNEKTIPKEYFSNRENWELNVANQINGTFSEIRLVITPEQLSQN